MEMWKKCVSVFLAALLCCLVLAGCSPEETHVVLPVEAVPESLDPAISENTSVASIAVNCYEGLVRVDENGNVQKGAADHWSISDDGLTYTFTLREGLKWHVPDAESRETAEKNPLGADYILSFPTAMTADDFAFGLQRAVAKNTGAPGATRLLGIVNAEAIYAGEAKASTLGVSVLNENTLRIQLTAPDGNFLYALAEPSAMPCSRAFFGKTAGRYGLTPHLMLCNGPYYADTLSSDGSALTITKNPDYVGNYPGHVDQCTFRTAPDTPEDLTAALLADENPMSAALFGNTEPEGLSKDFEITAYPNTVNVLAFNMGSDFSGNKDLRLALTTATDVDTLVAENLRKAEGVVPDCCDAVSGTMYRLSAGKVEPKPFNLKKAKKYYAAAREKAEAAATPDEPAPTSFDITFLCLEKDKTLAQAVVQNWQKVFGTNLSVTVEPVETEGALSRAMAANRYDVALTPVTTTELIATNVLRPFSEDSDRNFLHLGSDEYDELIANATASSKPETVTRYVLAAERYLVDEGILLPISQESTYLAVNKRYAEGLTVLPTGTVYQVYNIQG